MSVINAMLNKLDARGVAAAAHHGLPAAASASTATSATAAMPPRRAGTSTSTSKNAGAGWRLPILVLVGGAAIAFTALGDWPALLRPAPAAAAATASPAAATLLLEPRPAIAPEAAAPAPAAADVALVAPAAPSAAIAPIAAVATAPRAAEPVVPHSPAPGAAAKLAPAAPPPPPPATEMPAMALPSALSPPLPALAQIDKRAQQATPEQRLMTLYRQAIDAAQTGQRRTALAHALAALALEPRHADSRQLAAVLAFESGDAAQAAQLLREGLALDAPRGAQAPDPQRGAQALLLARVLVAQGDSTGALQVLDQQGVGGAEAEGLRGGVLAQQGDFRRALVAYDSATRQQPANALWWLGLGVALDSEGQRPRARQAYAKARALGLARDDLLSFVDQRLASAD